MSGISKSPKSSFGSSSVDENVAEDVIWLNLRKEQLKVIVPC